MRTWTRRPASQTPGGLRAPLGLEWPSQRVVFASEAVLKKCSTIKTCRGDTRAPIIGFESNSTCSRVVDRTTSKCDSSSSNVFLLQCGFLPVQGIFWHCNWAYIEPHSLQVPGSTKGFLAESMTGLVFTPSSLLPAQSVTIKYVLMLMSSHWSGHPLRIWIWVERK